MDNRPQNKTLPPDLLDLFYKILIFCESDALNTKNLQIKDSRIKEFIKDNRKKGQKGNVVLTYNSKSPKNKKINFDSALEYNEIRFNNTKRNVLKSLLCHLRHSFAHNRLHFADNPHTILCMENRYHGITNMKGKVKTADFKRLITAILSFQNN